MTDSTTTNNLTLLNRGTLTFIELWRTSIKTISQLFMANTHDGKDCAWMERDDVTGVTLSGIKRPPGKGCTAYYSWSWWWDWLDSQYTLIFRSPKKLVITMMKWLLIILRSGLLPHFSPIFHLTVLLWWIMPFITVVIVTLSKSKVGQSRWYKIGFMQRELNSQRMPWKLNYIASYKDWNLLLTMLLMTWQLLQLSTQST